MKNYFAFIPFLFNYSNAIFEELKKIVAERCDFIAYHLDYSLSYDDAVKEIQKIKECNDKQKIFNMVGKLMKNYMFESEVYKKIMDLKKYDNELIECLINAVFVMPQIMVKIVHSFDYSVYESYNKNFKVMVNQDGFKVDVNVFYMIEYMRESVETTGETEEQEEYNSMERKYVYSLDSTFRQSRAI